MIAFACLSRRESRLHGRWPVATALLIGATISGLTSCRSGSGTDAGSASAADGSRDPGGIVVGTPPAATGDPTADRFVARALSCGPQSYRTVPTGWQMFAVGEKGCTAWRPSSWVVEGAGTSVTVASEGPTGAGFLAMVGTPQVSIPCTPRGASDLLKSLLGQGCSTPQEPFYKEGAIDVAGVQIPTADVILSCATSGVTKLGYFWVSIQGTWPLCNLLILGYWVPADSIDAKICVASQVFNSVRCPSAGGGSCSDAGCSADCLAQGASGGSCDSGGNCVCN